LHATFSFLDAHRVLIVNASLVASALLKSHVQGNKVLIVTNDRIAPMYLEKYKNLLSNGGDLRVETLILPDGEDNKNLSVLNLILDKCMETALDRKATLVALGGGVIGDMVGLQPPSTSVE
jgi:3-dehydroquinate synthase